MKTIDLIRMGFRNLSRRKARTALTVIGVVIGTISIVIMISIGLGMTTNFQKQVMELGSLTTVTVEKSSWVADNQDNYQEVKQVLDENFLMNVQSMDYVKAAYGMYSSNITLFTGKYTSDVTVYGLDYKYLGELGLPETTYGTIPTEEEKDVLILGSSVPQNFYNPNSSNYQPFVYDPEKMQLKGVLNDWDYNRDENAKIKKKVIRKVTVLAETSGYEGYDWSAYMDLSTYQSWYQDFLRTLKPADRKKAKAKSSQYNTVKIIVDNVKHVKDVQDTLKELGYESSSLTSMTESLQKTSSMLQLVLGCVGGVAMLVSAISIANTMIMSIYERTKEIGVMKVLGCLLHDIKKLFLFESGAIGLLGGAIGVLLSYLGSFCINKFGGPIFDALVSSGGLGIDTGPVKYSVIPLWLPLAAVGFAIAVGVLSGYYPANRATKISPIEAMKSEG